jgi:excisionase family DNA binding protein
MEQEVETKATSSSPLMSVEEAAQYIGCGRSHMYAMLRTNAIPSLKIARLRKVRRVDLDRFIEEQARKARKENAP